MPAGSSAGAGEARSADFQAFSRVVRSRFACQRFDPARPIPPGLLEDCLALALRSPSGWNLQPWVFILIQDPNRKTSLCEAALGQREVLDAPATIVVAANRFAVTDNIEAVAAQAVGSGQWTPAYAQRVREYTCIWGQTDQCLVLQTLKVLALELARPFRPLPSIPLSLEAYVTKQASLAAMTLMLAATSAGLATCPMEGIDESRVRRVVGLPSNFCVPMVIPVGYAMEQPAVPSPRLPSSVTSFRERLGVPLAGIEGTG